MTFLIVTVRYQFEDDVSLVTASTSLRMTFSLVTVNNQFEDDVFSIYSKYPSFPVVSK